MNVSLDTSFRANKLASAGFEQTQDISAAKSDMLKAGGIYGPALTITEKQLTGMEALDDNFEADLRRDDALGKLVMSVFDFKPPEAPEFV
jgi:hypothetical protein